MKKRANYLMPSDSDFDSCSIRVAQRGNTAITRVFVRKKQKEKKVNGESLIIVIKTYGMGNQATKDEHIVVNATNAADAPNGDNQVSGRR